PACRGAVQADLLTDPDVDCRDNEGLTLTHEAHMADQAFVEDLMNHRPVVDATLGKPFQSRALRRVIGVGHKRTFRLGSIIAWNFSTSFGAKCTPGGESNAVEDRL